MATPRRVPGANWFRKLRERFTGSSEELPEEAAPQQDEASTEEAGGAEGFDLERLPGMLGLDKASTQLSMGANLMANFLPGGMALQTAALALTDGYSNELKLDEALDGLIENAAVRRVVADELGVEPQDVTREDIQRVILAQSVKLHGEGDFCEGMLQSLGQNVGGLAAAAVMPGGFLLKGGALLAGSVAGGEAMQLLMAGGGRTNLTGLLSLLADYEKAGGKMDPNIQKLALALRLDDGAQQQIETELAAAGLGASLEEALTNYIGAKTSGDRATLRHMDLALRPFDADIAAGSGLCEACRPEEMDLSDYLRHHRFTAAELVIGDLPAILARREERAMPQTGLAAAVHDEAHALRQSGVAYHEGAAPAASAAPARPRPPHDEPDLGGLS